MLLDQTVDDPKVSGRQPVILRQLDGRFEPVLGFPVAAVDVNMIRGSSREKKKKRKPRSRKIVGLTFSLQGWLAEGNLRSRA